MWPFSTKIAKQSLTVEQQIAHALKSYTPQEIQPRWILNAFQSKKNWNTDTAIKEGYNASAVVYAAIEKRAKLVSSVPWKAMRKKSDGTKEWVQDSDLQRLINNPNPDQSWLELMYYASQQLDLSGDGFISKIKITDNSEPSALWVLPSSGAKVKQGSERLIDQYEFGKKKVNRDDMIHLKLPSPESQIFGQPILMSGSRATDIDREGADWQKSGLQNRGILDVMISVPEGTDQSVVQGILKRWKERNSGSKNARDPVVTSGDVKNLGQTAHEMDFVNSRKSVWTEIAAAFGVPLAALGFTESVNLANAKEMNRMIWVDTIIPLLELLKRQLDKQLASEFGAEWRLEYDLSNVSALQENFDVKLANAERLQRMGYTRNEINQRLELGFEEDEAGNTRYEPFGLIPVGDADDDESEDDTSDTEKAKLHLLSYGK
jgi:HK97 family phage portal protein